MEVAGAVDDNFPKGSINAQQQAPPGLFHSHLDLVSSLSDFHQRSLPQQSPSTKNILSYIKCAHPHTTPASLRNSCALLQTMSSQWSFEEIDSADECEIPPSPSCPLPRQRISALNQDLKNDNSAGEISSIVSTATSDYTMPTGGTSFLDLPLELRIMVYDLAIPNDYSWNFRMPGKPKTVVKGINLLRSCRQVRAETSNRIWNRGLCIGFVTSPIDMEFAMSGLNSSALAKLVHITISFNIDPDALSPWGPIDVKALSNLKSLFIVRLNVNWGSYKKQTSLDLSSELVFLTGFTIQILTQIPEHVRIVHWNVFYCAKGMKSQYSDVLEVLATKYKSLRGSAYKSQAENS